MLILIMALEGGRTIPKGHEGSSAAPKGQNSHILCFSFFLFGQ
jgi:hypothetical protein